MASRRKEVIGRILEKSQGLSRYDIGETRESLARKSGRKLSEILKLNSNENFFVPLDLLRDLLREAVEEADPRLYPGEESEELRDALGRYMNVSSEEIVIGTGGDQLIDLVSRMLLRYGDEAISITPTFSIYEQCARIQGAIYKTVPLRNDFSLDIDSIWSSITPKTKLLFLCSPNNPTANQFDRQDITMLVEGFEGIAVIDEAYADFAKYSVVDLARKFENVIILRTFSKAFGLAGLRLGYSITNSEFATTILEKFQLPYSVSNVALRLGLKLLERIQTIRNSIEELELGRTKLMKALNRIEGVRAFDSETNFILFEVNRNSDDVYRGLLEKGVIVKNLGRVLHLDNCLRVAVAPSDMSELFLASLKEVLSERDV
jgi:histidinol-phosphate aminotransferase